MSLKGSLDYESVGHLLDIFEQAGMNMRDIERIALNPNAARAALLAARNVKYQSPIETVPIVITLRQIRAIMEWAAVPDEIAKKYRKREDFSRLVESSRRITPRGIDIVLLHLGASRRANKALSQIEIAEKYNLTRERVRQIIHSTKTELLRAMATDRPPIIDQVDEKPLRTEVRELLTLLG